MVLAQNSVQKAIATALLKDCGIEAQFGEWDSSLFSEFRLREVVLTAPDATQLSLPEVTIRTHILSLIFTDNFSFEFSTGAPAQAHVLGQTFDFEVQRLAVSTAADEKNVLDAWFAATGTEPADRIVCRAESENASDIAELTVPAWIAGTRKAHCRAGRVSWQWEADSGQWVLADTTKAESPDLAGKGTLNAERVAGELTVRAASESLGALGFFKTLPVCTGNFQVALAGDWVRKTAVFQNRFHVEVKNVAGSFGAYALSPDLDFRGQGELSFSEGAFSVKTFFADVAATGQETPRVVFSKISIPGELQCAYARDGGVAITAVGGGDELARWEFNEVPLALANPFLSHSTTGNPEKPCMLDGALNGALILKQRDAETFVFSGQDALEIKDFSFAHGELVVANALSARLPVEMVLRTDVLELNIAGAKVFAADDSEVAHADFSGTRHFVGEKTGIALALQARADVLNRQILEDSLPDAEACKWALKTTLKAEVEDAGITVSEFDLRLLAPEGRPCLSARTEAFSYRLEKPSESLKDKQIDFYAEAFPLALLNPLSGGKYRFSGTLDGAVTLVATQDALEFTSAGSALEIRDFSMRDAHAVPVLNDLSLRSKKNLLRIAQEKSGHLQTVVDVQQGILTDGSKRKLLSGDLYLDFSGSRLCVLKGALAGEFEGIFAQPVLRTQTGLDSGTFEMNGILDAREQGSKFTMTCHRLRAREGAEIKRVDCSFEQGDFKGDVVRAVLEVQGEEHSIMRARFSRLDFDSASGVTQFNARVNIPELAVTDFYTLRKILESPEKEVVALSGDASEATGQVAELAPEPPKNEARNAVVRTSVAATHTPIVAANGTSREGTGTPESASPQTRTVRVPWERFIGEATFEIDSLIVPENRLNGISGTLSLLPQRAELLAGTPSFFGGTLDFEALAEVRPGKLPVTARAKMTVRESRLNEAIPLLRAKNPPMVEGRFALDFWVKSEAETFDALQENVFAKANLLGHNGRVRVFAADNKEVRTVGNLAQMGGEVIGMLGAFAGGFSKRAARLGNAVRDLQRYLSDFPFDVHEIQLTYASGKPIICNKFLLQNEVLKISGNGEITYSPEKPIGDAPIDATARLDVRGELEELLRVVKVLKDERDPALPDADYIPGPKFKFSGTLNNISDNLLETLLSTGLNLEL